MKAFIVLVLTLTTQFAMALPDAELYFSSGDATGQKVTDAGYIGYYKICFTGDATQAAWKLYRLLNDDIEKGNPFARAATNKKSITYGYTETKCTDEGLSEFHCRSDRKAFPCKK